MTEFSLFYMGAVFIAGIISFLSPCIFPLIPVYMGILLEDTGEKKKKILGLDIYLRPILKTLAFIAGLSSIFLILGFGAGALGSLINSKYTPIIMGAIVVILGIHQAEFITIKALYTSKTVDFNKENRGGILGAFLLGLGFSFGWTPCVGPVLGTVLAISATGGSQSIYGLVLMAFYSLGLAIPFIILTLASSLIMKHFTKIKQHMKLIKRIGGILIIIMGLLLMFGQFNQLGIFFTNLLS